MTTYCKGQPGERSDILDFINMVFSMHSQPHDFRALLPKLYGPDRTTECFHYLAKEDGAIRAAVCVLPVTLEAYGLSMTCGTLGSVSVHPYSRGKGYMKTLMAMAASDMEQQGIAMSVLDGKRHRYQYYGYEPGGHLLEYHLIPDNFRHCSGRYPDHSLSLTPVRREDAAITTALHELYMRQPIHTDRKPEDFFAVCSSWNSTLYAIIKEGRAAGYLCGASDHVYELVLSDESDLYSALRSYMARCDCKRLTLTAAPHDQKRIRELSGLYERLVLRSEDNYRILRYPEAVRFFLTVKSHMTPLKDGSLVLKPENQAAFRVIVSGQSITVSPTDDTPDLALNDVAMMDLLFSPQSYYREEPLPVLMHINWFPLPLSMSHLDKC